MLSVLPIIYNVFPSCVHTAEFLAATTTAQPQPQPQQHTTPHHTTPHSDQVWSTTPRLSLNFTVSSAAPPARDRRATMWGPQELPRSWLSRQHQQVGAQGALLQCCMLASRLHTAMYIPSSTVRCRRDPKYRSHTPPSSRWFSNCLQLDVLPYRSGCRILVSRLNMNNSSPQSLARPRDGRDADCPALSACLLPVCQRAEPVLHYQPACFAPIGSVSKTRHRVVIWTASCFIPSSWTIFLVIPNSPFTLASWSVSCSLTHIHVV